MKVSRKTSQEDVLAKYLWSAKYTAEGTRGLLKEGGVSRRETISALVNKMGGTVESFYFAFGENDVYAIADLPDNVSAAAIALAVNSTDVVQVSTTVLMTPEEVDEATRKTVEYRAPGK